MKIVIAGGTGLIGKELTKFLIENGHEITILTRKISVAMETDIHYVEWLTPSATPEKFLREADAIINLAGVSINDGRWNKHHQQAIYESRMTATKELIKIISEMDKKPSVYLNASAIGLYPASFEKVYTEDSLELADDFLGKTVQDWENIARTIHVNYEVRTVYLRFGVILSNKGGAMPLMVLPYKLFCGGRVGSGEQWLSWIHMKDVVKAIMFAIENNQITGPVNVTAPYPVRMNDFGKTVSTLLRRPHWLPVPAFAMKFLLGKKSALVLEGNKVLPKKLTEEGFLFQYPHLQDALEELLLNNND